MSFVKGQSSFEYLMITGIGLLLASPFVLVVQQQSVDVESSVEEAEFANSLEQMEHSVERADVLGEPARTSFDFNVPRGVEESYLVDGRAAVFTVERGGGVTNFTVFFDSEVEGDLPTEQGFYSGEAEAFEDFVNISFRR